MGTNIPVDIPENIFASMTNFGKKAQSFVRGKIHTISLTIPTTRSS
jgi:hypothetical protein